MTTSRRGFLARLGAAAAAIGGLKIVSDYRTPPDVLEAKPAPEKAETHHGYRGTCGRCYAHNAVLTPVLLPPAAGVDWRRLEDVALADQLRQPHRYEDWCAMCVALGPDVQLYRVVYARERSYISGDGLLSPEAIRQLGDRIGNDPVLFVSAGHRAATGDAFGTARFYMGRGYVLKVDQTPIYRLSPLVRMEWLIVPWEIALRLDRASTRHELWPYMARRDSWDDHRKHVEANLAFHHGKEWIRRNG